MEKGIEIINNWNLKKLFTELEQGNIKIPRFQRDYVWERTKVIKLLNSIHSKYPIGTFFFWVAPKEYEHFVREVKDFNFPENIESTYFQFILDGQQRITSLYAALKGFSVNSVDFETIYFNLNLNRFYIPRSKDKIYNIPVSKILDDSSFNEIYTDCALYDRDHKTDYAIKLRECQETFLNYPISIVKTFNPDLDEVVEIFERINQGGSKLSIFDLVHASVWNAQFDLREEIKNANKLYFNNNYNINLSERVYLNSLSLNIFKDCKSSSQLKLTTELCVQYWDKTIKSIQNTLEFIAGIGVKSGLDSYQNIITTLQNYFITHSTNTVSSNSQKIIEKWFWESKFNKRYTSSSPQKMKEDIIWLSKLD